MELSIVTTLYRSEPFVAEFYQRMLAAAKKCSDDIEFIFVDDGSPDGSGALVKAITAQDPRVTLVELSRNFGHHCAIMAGLSHARGDYVFLIDVDLEEQPEWIAEFWEELKGSDADMIFGVEERRKGSFFKRYSGALFYKLFNLLSETKIPENLCTVRLMKRRFVRALLDINDSNLFLAGIVSWAGFVHKALPRSKNVRPMASSYKLTRMLSLFLNAITSFSSYPLKAIFFLGMSLAIISGGFGTALIVERLLSPESMSVGWPSVMVSIWFLGGVIIAFVGVIGIYLSKIFVETKNRPLYIVREIYSQNKNQLS